MVKACCTFYWGGWILILKMLLAEVCKQSNEYSLLHYNKFTIAHWNIISVSMLKIRFFCKYSAG